MSLIAKEKGGDFKLVPAGTHIAVCNIVADVGLQEGFYGVKEKVIFRFEIPAERTQYNDNGVDKEGPLVISATYTNSLSKKGMLRKDLEGWRGRAFTPQELNGFDLSKVLGAPCMLNVVHEPSRNGDRMFSNIRSISALPRGTPAPHAELPLILYSSDKPDQYEALPEWIRKKIDAQVKKAEPSSAGYTQEGDPGMDPNDDIPFMRAGLGMLI